MQAKRSKNRASLTRERALPNFLRLFFWDVDFKKLSWNSHSEFIAERILTEGSWEAIKWLRHGVKDDFIRTLICKKLGRGFTKKQVFFWGQMLDFDAKKLCAEREARFGPITWG